MHHNLGLSILRNLNRILKVHSVKSKILKLINVNMIRFYLLIYLVSYCNKVFHLDLLWNFEFQILDKSKQPPSCKKS